MRIVQAPSRLVAIALACGLAAAACSTSTPAASAPPSATAPSSSAAANVELTITGQEYAFALPTSVPAGTTTITLTNTGKETHQAQLARIADGKTFADVLAALQQDEGAAFALFSFAGGPNGVAPGAKVSVIQKLEPGSYVILCFVPAPDGLPHLAKGMVAPLQVTAPATAGALPAADATLTLKDFGFEGLPSVSSGRHSVTVTNQGPQPHEATIVKLNDGVTVDALRTQLASGGLPAGPPPWQFAGGMGALTSGGSGVMNLDLQPGRYAFICQVPDAATGKPHMELGMIAALDVT